MVFRGGDKRRGPRPPSQTGHFWFCLPILTAAILNEHRRMATGFVSDSRQRAADIRAFVRADELASGRRMQPLSGITIVDFSTLLPGPLASLILAEAGATVIKIERPGGGDELRGYEPRFGPASVGFALLNRGKRSVALDLKANGARRRLLPLLRSADVLLEQFRPGVMDRLGLATARWSRSTRA